MPTENQTPSLPDSRLLKRAAIIGGIVVFAFIYLLIRILLLQTVGYEKYLHGEYITEERTDELEIIDQGRDEKKSGFARLLSAFGIGN